MSYAPPAETDVRDQLLDVYRGKFAGADTSPASEIFARASVAAAATTQVCHGVRSVEDQVFPDTADSDNVERHAAMYDMARKAPTVAAGGSLSLWGTPGTVVGSGLTAFHADGTEFVTTSGGTVAGIGILVVDLDAVSAGAAGNKSTGAVLQLSSPPTGINAAASVVVSPSGGTDDESDEDLAARVLERMRKGNAGGTLADYEQWALTIDGVIEAHCLPTRLGPGTVTVAVYSLGAGGFRAQGSAALRASVLAYLDTVRPVTATVDVPAVVEAPLDVTVTSLEVEPGFEPTEVQAAVEAAIDAYIYGHRTNETAFLTQLGRAIASVVGVRDYSLDAPTATRTEPGAATDVSIFVPGTVSVSLL